MVMIDDMAHLSSLVMSVGIPNKPYASRLVAEPAKYKRVSTSDAKAEGRTWSVTRQILLSDGQELLDRIRVFAPTTVR
jgi:hypothetical protein